MTASHVARHCTWEACDNIRDLGGYPTCDGSQTRWGALVRADDLSRLTPIGRRALRAYGIRTIVDLRSPVEVAEAPHPFAHNEPGMPTLTYQHMPFIDPTDRTVDHALSTVMPLPDIYRLFLVHCPTQIGTILHAIAHAEPGGVLVHCTAGKDRTGLVVAFALALAGVADEQIVADYALSDQYLQRFYAERLASVTHDPQLHARLVPRLTAAPEVMRHTLAFLRTHYGSLVGYLAHTGLPAQEMTAVARRLCEDNQGTVPS